MFGTSVITCITAQNTQGVHGVYPLSAESVKAQI
ncbi:bifunctional hydroxymethylpyrimidine kinase/phosphomethylpyrimidine kinase [Helicobacter pylori]